MEILNSKIGGKHYLRLCLDGRVLHETECHFDQVDYFATKYESLYRLWSQEQHKAVLNRWATFEFVAKAMDFPMETGAHAAIFSMVNFNVYS